MRLQEFDHAGNGGDQHNSREPAGLPVTPRRRGVSRRAAGRTLQRAHEVKLADNQGVATNRTRVALAEDDVLLREGLASLLERRGFDVVGQCGDPTELLALVREHRPELAIVDIRMPPDHATEGLEAAREGRPPRWTGR